MAKIKFIHVLCPARHMIAALAFETAKTTEKETRLVLAEALRRNNINACRTCNTRDLRFESVETNFNTLAEAGRTIVENNDVAFVEMHKKPEIHDSVRLPPSHCVRCKKELDAAIGIGRREVKSGDISVCGYCGQVMLFRADKRLRAAEADELAAIKAEMARSYPMTLRMLEKLTTNFVAARARREN